MGAFSYMEIKIQNIDPVKIYESLKGLPYAVLLDSSLKDKKQGRYSIITADPFMRLISKNGVNCLIDNNGNARKIKENTFTVLKNLLRNFSFKNKEERFLAHGCAIGYLSYDLNQQLEKLTDFANDDLDIPDCVFCFYDAIYVVDESLKETTLISTGLPFKGDDAEARAIKRMNLFIGLLKKENGGKKQNRKNNCKTGIDKINCNFSKEEYLEAIKKAVRYIEDGDIFQVNLSQRFSVDIGQGDPWLTYKNLRKISPADFSVFFDAEEFAVLSSSPERFLKVTGQEVETRPIKGTRPRSDDKVEDLMLAEELNKSEKDRAENIMIVDVLRNDLGRVCKPGSVATTNICELEKYKTVMHLVSTVKGELEGGKDIVDLLEATFPGGSITGAPKIRAMEIIDELEPTKRGTYTGCLGYIGFDGCADLNILIRTILIKNGMAYFQVGGGIVADSDPEKEYQETIDKGKAMFAALDATFET
jgi:para-aminobenzoate synthetase component 1